MKKLKLIITVQKLICNPKIDGKQSGIFTVSVFDIRTNNLWALEQIKERGISYFLNEEDMKQSLCWNTNSQDSLYEVFWTENSDYGTIYLYD